MDELDFKDRVIRTGLLGEGTLRLWGLLRGGLLLRRLLLRGLLLRRLLLMVVLLLRLGDARLEGVLRRRLPGLGEGLVWGESAGVGPPAETFEWRTKRPVEVRGGMEWLGHFLVLVELLFGRGGSSFGEVGRRILVHINNRLIPSLHEDRDVSDGGLGGLCGLRGLLGGRGRLWGVPLPRGKPALRGGRHGPLASLGLLSLCGCLLTEVYGVPEAVLGQVGILLLGRRRGGLWQEGLCGRVDGGRLWGGGWVAGWGSGPGRRASLREIALRVEVVVPPGGDLLSELWRHVEEQISEGNVSTTGFTCKL